MLLRLLGANATEGRVGSLRKAGLCYRPGSSGAAFQVLRRSSTSALVKEPTKTDDSSTLDLDAGAETRGITPPAHKHIQIGGAKRPLYRLTLDRHALTPGDYLDLSGAFTKMIAVVPRRDMPLQGPSNITRILSLRRARIAGSPSSFPPGSAGFLYHHLPPKAPTLVAEVRFRVTRSPDPSRFASSPDLLMDDGFPWRIPMTTILSHRQTHALWPVLLADGFVSEELLSTALAQAKSRINWHLNSRVVYRFGQPFLLSLKQAHHMFDFIRHDNRVCNMALRGLTTLPILGPASTRLSAYKGLQMYSAGSAVCCFEKVPRTGDMRSDAIVVRVLRIVEPPRLRPLEDLQRDIPAVSPELLAKLEPREGEVLRVVGWGGEPEPCGWRVDESTARWKKVKEGFQVLYENEAYTSTMST